jgi:hypothetical protein
VKAYSLHRYGVGTLAHPTKMASLLGHYRKFKLHHYRLAPALDKNSLNVLRVNLEFCLMEFCLIAPHR